MMTTKHTPGPWTIKEYDNGFTGEQGPHGIFSPLAAGHTQQMPLVASVWGSSLEESDANARLIAAAPEMREHLERLLSLIGSGSLEIGYMDRRATEVDVADSRALLARIDGDPA